MKKNRMLKKVGVAFALAVSFLSNGSFVDVYANGNTQVVNRTVSYAYPETGESVDGGTNIALGDSMANSIVDPEVLVEHINGRTYVTLGLDLMSNVRYVKVKIQKHASDSYEKFQEVPIKLVGSCVRQDTCNHYRFEVSSTSNYISPIMFVEPMGREVQFFIKLNMASAKPGRGNFDHKNNKSEAADKTESSKPSKKPSSESNAIVKPSKSDSIVKQDKSEKTDKKASKDKEDKKNKKEDKNTSKNDNKKPNQDKKPTESKTDTNKEVKENKESIKDNTNLKIGIGIGCIVVVAGASVILYKKRKG